VGRGMNKELKEAIASLLFEGDRYTDAICDDERSDTRRQLELVDFQLFGGKFKRKIMEENRAEIENRYTENFITEKGKL
jgi:hypothetical protein